MSIILKHTSDAMSYRVYVDNINVEISGASFAVTGLTFGSATPDNSTTPRSVVVPVTGGVHGRTYQGVGTFTLAAGGPLVRPVTIRVFDS